MLTTGKLLATSALVVCTIAGGLVASGSSGKSSNNGSGQITESPVGLVLETAVTSDDRPSSFTQGSSVEQLSEGRASGPDPAPPVQESRPVRPSTPQTEAPPARVPAKFHPVPAYQPTYGTPPGAGLQPGMTGWLPDYYQGEPSESEVMKSFRETGKIPVDMGYTEQEQKIHDKLSELTAINFPGNPLDDAMRFLSEQLGIPILIDSVGLADVGTSDDELIELVVQNVSTRDALDLMLADKELGYLIEDGVLKITSRMHADDRYFTRIYAVEPLGFQKMRTSPFAGTLTGQPRGDAELLKEVIMKGTDGSWSDEKGAGGEGTITFFNGSLVIRQTQAVHEEIHKLLSSLAKQVQATSR